MRCPRCTFVGEASQGRCPQCGYGEDGRTSGSLLRQQVSSPMPIIQPSFMRGDTLQKGRYRLLEQVTLPKNQQRQGTAWLAQDAQFARRHVLIRQVAFPTSQLEEGQRLVDMVVRNFRNLSQHPGFAGVVDVFYERGMHYLVLQQPLGTSLEILLQQQGGALPEAEVAEYGRQLCEMLSLLAQQEPPLVHGAISPETIFINPETHQAYLMYMPVLSPSALHKDDALAGYRSPEQVQGETPPSADLYALAATLHHAVTGYNPRERMAFFHPPARRLNPAVSSQMEGILSKELRLSLSQRYAHPSTMQKALADLVISSRINIPPAPLTPKYLPLPTTIQSSKRRRQLGTKRVVIIGIISVAIIAILFSVSLVLISSHASSNDVAQRATLQQEIAQEMPSYQSKGIGISDGNLAFDIYQGRPDTSLKQQAAQDLQQGNTSDAVNLLSEAVSADSNDGEAQIYNEDVHLLQANARYVTVAVGLPIDNTDIHLSSARGELEAVYLAQHEVNTSNALPDGLKLRVIIVNSGQDDGNVGTVAQFLAKRVSQAGNPTHILALVGWPYSHETINARDIIAGVHLPIIAPTASSVSLSGTSSYFFRACPPDNLQGITIGTLLVDNLQAKQMLVLQDPTDAYSVSLSNAVGNQVKSLGANIDTAQFTEQKTSVGQYQQVVEQAIAKNDDTIFIAGLSVDGVRLAHAVGNEMRDTPGNQVLQHLRIMGGDALSSGVLLGQGNNADAQIAKTFPQDMQFLTFTSFGSADEWDLQNIPQSQQPQFFSDWKTTYQHSSVFQKPAPDPTFEPILFYDATRVAVDAMAQVQGDLTGDAVRAALASLGHGQVPAYQGASGRIEFDNQGNPVDKAIVLLSVQDNGQGKNEIKALGVAGKFR